MGGAVIAAAAARARRRVVSHFLSQDAVSAENAVGYEPDRRMERRHFERLREAGVILPTTAGRYYVDVPKLDADRDTRRKRGAMIAAAVAVIAGVAVALGG